MRLMVAYTNESHTCRTPHFTSDLLLALKDYDVSIKRVSFTNGYETDLVVNDFHVAVREADGMGTFSVRSADRFVLAQCARTALAPVSVQGTSLLPLFVERYNEGQRLDDLDKDLAPFSLTAMDVHWEHVFYLEVAPIVNAIDMLIPSSSLA